MKELIVLQSLPRDSNDKDVGAMLAEVTIEADEESFVIILQHGSNDKMCERSIKLAHVYSELRADGRLMEFAAMLTDHFSVSYKAHLGKYM